MSRALSVAVLSVVASLSTTSRAAPIAPNPFSGSGFDVNYCGQNGLWNERADNSLPGAGLDWNSTPISAPGDPWQQVSIDSTGGTFEQNGNECLGILPVSPWDTLTVAAYGSITPITFAPFGGYSGTNGSTTTWRAGDLQIHKHEYWGAAGRGYEDGISLARESQALIIDITVTNLGCRDSDFVLMHGVDPDQDVQAAGDFTTCNDTVPSQNFVFSEGTKTGIVTGYGRCNDGLERVGHTVWDPDANGGAFSDENYTRNDYTQHINHKDTVPAQQSVTFKFIFVSAISKDHALKRYYETREEVCCSPAWDVYEKDASYLATLPRSCGSSVTPAAARGWVSPNATGAN
jgi:hypothetical protein